MSRIIIEYSSKSLFEKIINDVMHQDFFLDFKFRKRDSFLYKVTEYGRCGIELDHWRSADLVSETECLLIYPMYGIRFDILHKWFEKFNVKPLQIQRDDFSVGFSGIMLSMQDTFQFRYDGIGYEKTFHQFYSVLSECAKRTFDCNSTLPHLYDNIIEPILNGKKEMPDLGADWVFLYLTLCKIVAPDNYFKFKQMVLKRVDELYYRKYREPNINKYYDKLEDILSYLESINF